MNRSRVRGALPWIAAVVSLGALAGWLRANDADLPPAAALHVPEGALALGDLPAAKQWVVEVPVTNTGLVDATVNGVLKSCQCTQVEPASFVVPAQSTITLKVTFDLSAQFGRDLEQAERAFKHELTFELPDAAMPKRSWEFTGRVVQPLEVSPAFVQFDEQLIAGREFTTREFSVLGRQPLSALSASCDPRWGTVEVIPAANHAFQVRVRPNADLPVGPHQFPITLAGVDSSGQRLTEQTVSVLAKVVSEVSAYPRAVSFGLISLDAATERDVVFTSRNQQKLAFVEAKFPTGMEVSAQQVSSADGLVVRLTPHPTKPGVQSGLATFVVRDEAGTLHETSLRVSLEPQPASLALAQNSTSTNR